MRIARLLFLIAYAAGPAVSLIPLPDGGCPAGACGCGDSCCCSQAKVAAGTCCCGKNVKTGRQAKAKSCCSAKSNSCCDQKEDRPLALMPCGCQQETPSGMIAGSDPRLMPRAVSPPNFRTSDWLPLATDPAAPLFTQSPDDPVPRPTA